NARAVVLEDVVEELRRVVVNAVLHLDPRIISRSAPHGEAIDNHSRLIYVNRILPRERIHDRFRTVSVYPCIISSLGAEEGDRLVDIHILVVRPGANDDHVAGRGGTYRRPNRVARRHEGYC